MSQSTPQSTRRRGFTLVELLVVIGIIAVLIAILVPVATLIRKRAQETRTRAFIQKLSAACHAYYSDFSAYPGIIDDQQLYGFSGPKSGTTPSCNNLPLTDQNTNQPVPFVTSSENLVLSLIGGTSVSITPPTGPITAFNYSIDLVKMGGLQSLNPANQKSYHSYIDYNSSELSTGQFYDPKDPFDTDSPVPEFIDSFSSPWPIIYIRARAGAKLPSGDGGDDAQYKAHFLGPYWRNYDSTGTAYVDFPTYDKPMFPGGKFDSASVNFVLYNTAADFFKSPSIPDSARGRDTFILISAGADHSFGSKDDIISAE